MRITAWLSALLLIAMAACGSGTDTPADTAASEAETVATTSQPSTTARAAGTTTEPTSTTTATSTTLAETTTTAIDTTTTTEPAAEWTTAEYGRSPTVSLGPSAALGSGCGPGTDDLPDGIWFGWITTAGDDAVEFDLACLWPGRWEPAASNDAARIRTVPLADTAVFYEAAQGPVDNAPGLPDEAAWWLFVNNGQATELAELGEAIDWVRVARGWPEVYPGCCDEGDVAPPSPPDPWPETGWPADGFYSLMVGESAWEYFEQARHPAVVGSYELTIRKWLDCDDVPDLCPEWWVGDEVTTDPDAPALGRALTLDGDVTVVIRPTFADDPIVGDGDAFAELIADLNAAAEQWIHTSDVDWDDVRERTQDPAFPFGLATVGGETRGLLSYRGPAGSHLTWDSWWFALEIRDGRPILYLHAGIVAG